MMSWRCEMKSRERKVYVSRTVPGWASVRGLAHSNAYVTVNGNAAFRVGEYYFGSGQFDNSTQAGFAELETVAVLNGATNDLVSVETNTAFIAAATDPYLYDDDGNQLRASTKTGSWQIDYNGENRPVRWTDGDRVLLMDYDHQGRRRLYAETNAGTTNILHRFTYDGYLCIERNREVDAADGGGAECFLWDPAEPVATRPLMFSSSMAPALLYCHDGNKNVSDLVAPDGSIAAHYEYSSFGKVVMATSGVQSDGLPPHLLNPYRFSSECHDDTLGLVYYNYRHYNPADGRWLGRDPVEEKGGMNVFGYVLNDPINRSEIKGTISWPLAISIFAIGLEALIVRHCSESSERQLPSGPTSDAFKHCYVSCENAKCLAKFNSMPIGALLTYLGGVAHEIAQLISGEAHTLEGSLADIKSNILGIKAAKNGKDCNDACGCENEHNNPL